MTKLTKILALGSLALVAEFEDAFAESRRQAKAAGMRPADINRMIAKARGSRRKPQVA